MSEDHRRSSIPLDYATPKGKRGNPILAITVGVLGVCAGLFGALMLFYGIPGIVDVFIRSPGRDFAGDLFVLVMILLIGAVCLYVSFRWCRAVRGIFVGR